MCMRSFLCVCVCMSVCDTQFPYGQRQEQKPSERKQNRKKKITNKEIKNNELTLAWVIEKKKRQKLKKKGSSAHNLPSTSYTKKKRTHLPHGKNDREEGGWEKKSTRSKDDEVSRTNESANKEKQSQYSSFFFFLTANARTSKKQHLSDSTTVNFGLLSY